MQADRWKRIQELYEAAVALPAEKRAEFLAQACPADAGLRGEVQSLLAQQADSFLESAPLSAIKTLTPGAKLGNFEIVELIGRGGMGEVYRARDSRLKRDVAVKVLPAGLARDPDRIARFEREARAAGALNHPNIVAVYDIGRDEGTYWIATELVAGESLAKVIERGPLAVPRALEIATQIADGLAAAHAAGIVHRDFKPANIMVTRDGRVKILDFGLALRRRTSQDSTTLELTDEGTVLGTAGYMSPEQVRGETVDQRSDLFSFGVILYEMLGGKRAFAGASSVEVMNAILKEEPGELPASVPPALERIVRRCLEKDRERRFQSAADLEFALEALSLTPTRTERPKRKAWWKWAALTAAFAIAGAAYWMAVRPSKLSGPSQLLLRRLTDQPGAADAAISPDGKLVAYVRKGDIWVQQVAGGGVIQITDDPAGDLSPEFSADGTQVAFRSERAGGGIYAAPALGGDARELVPEGRFPSFSPDGRWLMYWISPKSERWGGKIFIQPVSGGLPTQIDAGPAGACVADWSPDGHRILLVTNCGKDVPAVWTFNVDTRLLTSNQGLYPTLAAFDDLAQWISNPPRLLGWNRVADAFVVTAIPVSSDGTRATGPPQRLGSVTDPLNRVSAALDGSMVLSAAAKAHVWGLSIDAAGHAVGEPKQLTDHYEGESEPVLSRDGMKLLFVSRKANGLRIFYKDLATGHEKEISTGEGGYDTPIFNPDATGIICSHNTASVDYLPRSGGLPKKILDKFALVWDSSPDGKTLLLSTSPRWGVVWQLDLDSLSATTLLEDPELEAWQSHFSHDGHWVAFNATPDTEKSSRIYVVPFRKKPVPRSEWLPITQGDSDDKPRFSSNDKLIFFTTGGRNSRHALWAQKLASDMRPDGKPVVVYTPAGLTTARDFDDISVGPRLITFLQADKAGDIWLAQPVNEDAH